jgi:hypothetical protein
MDFAFDLNHFADVVAHAELLKKAQTVEVEL